MKPIGAVTGTTTIAATHAITTAAGMTTIEI